MSRRVIFDTSTLNYYILADEEELLRKLHERNEVVIPEAVLADLKNAGSPESVREWANNLPDWVKVEKVEVPEHIENHKELGRGEKEALALAERDKGNATLVIDEEEGRRVAKKLDLDYTGGYGLGFEAEVRGLADSRELHEKLRDSGMRIPPAEQHEQRQKEYLQKQEAEQQGELRRQENLRKLDLDRDNLARDHAAREDREKQEAARQESQKAADQQKQLAEELERRKDAPSSSPTAGEPFDELALQRRLQDQVDEFQKQRSEQERQRREQPEARRSLPDKDAFPANANLRYNEALARNFNPNALYSSLAKAALEESVAFQREQTALEKSLQTEKDPQRAEMLRLRRDIERNDYMAQAHQRMSGQALAIGGKHHEQLSADYAEQSKNFREEAKTMRQEWAHRGLHDDRYPPLNDKMREQQQQQRQAAGDPQQPPSPQTSAGGKELSEVQQRALALREKAIREAEKPAPRPQQPQNTQDDQTQKPKGRGRSQWDDDDR